MLDRAWPYLDRYTVRTAGLITAQQRTLGWDPHVAVGPVEPGDRARDESYTTASWGPDHQRRLGPPTGARRWEQPDLGLAPLTARAVREDLDEVVRSLRPALLHVHGSHTLARAALEVALPQQLPLVYEPRGELASGEAGRGSQGLGRARQRRVRDLIVAAAQDAGAVVATTEREAKALAGDGVPPDRMHLIPDAVDTTHFVPGQQREPDGTLHVGAFVPTAAAVDAARQLLAGIARARERGAPVRSTLAGSGGDTDLAALVAAHDLAEVTILPGAVTLGRAPALLRSLDVFVALPLTAAGGRWAASPGALEALACGVPVAAPDTPAVRARLAHHDGVHLIDLSAEGTADLLVDAAARPPARPSGDVGADAWASRVSGYVEVYDAAGAAAQI